MNLASHSVPRASQDPADRYRGSHSAILDGLGELRRLPMLYEALQQARLTAKATLDLFQRQVLPHHLDEEQELFVATVRAAAPGAEKQRVEEVVARLVAQHRRMEEMWVKLRPSVEAMSEGRVEAAPSFRDEVMTLVDTYLDHTRLEEKVFLPLADEILSRNQNGASALDPSAHLRPTKRPAKG